MSSSERPANKKILLTTVFVTGMVIMIFELVGSRVLAPYFGSGVDVWTSLIGLILASLSVGYFFGGRLADKQRSSAILGVLCGVSGLLIALTNASRDVVLRFFTGLTLDLPILVILSSIVVFTLPSICLGMIQPYALKLVLKDIKNAGKISGLVSTLSTTGGIIGTFLAGFVLIPFFGTSNLLLTIAFAMSLLSFLYRGKHLLKIILISAVVIVSSISSSLISVESIADIDTEYSRVIIYDREIDGRPTRVMTFGPFGFQSGIYLDNPNELVAGYIQNYDLTNELVPDSKRALMIGGGAFTFAEFYGNKYPGKHMDVVEIDSDLATISSDYFDFVQPANTTIFAQDGRRFIQGSDQTYDIVFMDAYSGAMNIPFHLTTVEFLEELKQVVEADGLVVANIIGTATGEGSNLVKRMVKTYTEVFDEVGLYQAPGTSKNQVQNLLLIASNNKVVNSPGLSGGLRSLLRRKVEVGIEDIEPLTDDKAPIDFLNQNARELIRQSQQKAK